MISSRSYIYGMLPLLFAGIIGITAGCQEKEATAQTSGPAAKTPAAALEPILTLKADLASNMMYVYQGDKEVGSYVISPGVDKHQTPRGAFKIRKLVWNPAWIPPDEEWAKKKTPKPPGHPKNPMKVVKIFFKEPDYYIHGTSEVDKLGMPASHGCIRMSPEDVEQVARWVMEHGGQPREDTWFKRLLRFRTETRVVYLKNPISITIIG